MIFLQISECNRQTNRAKPEEAIAKHCRHNPVWQCLATLIKMGNKASGQATQAVETVRKRLTIRRRNPQDESDFSALEIQRKFNNMPNLTEEEKKVLRSSWDIISHKVDQVRNLHSLDHRNIF